MPGRAYLRLRGFLPPTSALDVAEKPNIKYIVANSGCTGDAMEVVALAIIGFALLLVFSLGSKGSSSKDAPAVIPSSKIYEIYGDLVQPNHGDSDQTKGRRKKLREALAKLEGELKRAEDLRAAWENKRVDKKDVFDAFKKHGEAIAKHAGEAKEIMTELKG